MASIQPSDTQASGGEAFAWFDEEGRRAHATAPSPEAAIDADPWRVSFILALPFDALLPSNTTVTLFEPGHFRGFEPVEVTVLPGMAGLPEAGLHPGTSLWFKQAEIGAAEPLAAGRAAFGEDLPSTLGARSKDQSGPPFVAYTTVVQVTRIAGKPPRNKPSVFLRRIWARLVGTAPPLDAMTNWLTDQFDVGLSDLNEFLTVLNATTADWSFGPVDRLELPALVPYFVSDLRQELRRGPPRAPRMSLFLLHPRVPFEADRVPESSVAHAMRILAKQRREGHPFYAFAEALGGARRALYLGRHGQAVVQASSAVELMVDALIANLGPIRGYDAQRLSNVLDLGLKNKLRDHLGRLLSETVDLADLGSPVGAWYEGGYALRNRVAHQNYGPSRQEATVALDEVQGIIVWVARALHRDPATLALAEMLVVEQPASV